MEAYKGQENVSVLYSFFMFHFSGTLETCVVTTSIAISAADEVACNETYRLLSNEIQ